jgi:hypothetical protein
MTKTANIEWLEYERTDLMCELEHDEVAWHLTDEDRKKMRKRVATLSNLIDTARHLRRHGGA